MISYRQADIIEKIKEKDRVLNDPVGKTLILVPHPWRIDQQNSVITSYDDISVQSIKRSGMGSSMPHAGFLGIRDDKAFFINHNLKAGKLVGLYLYLKEKGKKKDSEGKIISADKGILKTDKGKEFKAEEHDYMDDELDSVTI